MVERILLVDDDPLCLAVWQRTLGQEFSIETAPDGLTGLSMLEQRTDFAVIVSDVRMPGVDGLEFLKRTVPLAPDAIRLVLTADDGQRTAARAINDCRIFRFLNKPCSRDTMSAAFRDAIAQYRLQLVERDLLDKSLKGCVSVLTDILGLVDPDAFGTATQLRDYVVSICRHYNVEKPWELEIAAMLSQLGRVTLSPQLLAKQRRGEPLGPDETLMLEHHPAVAAKLIRQIPRMERIAALIAHSQSDSLGSNNIPGGLVTEVQILRAAIDVQQAIADGYETCVALERIRRRKGMNDELYAAVRMAFSSEGMTTRAMRFRDLQSGMLLAEPLMSTNGMVLVQKGVRVSDVTLARLQNFATRSPIREPIQVLESA